MDNDGFFDLFSSYWWLLFPLAFFVAGGWSSFLRYRSTRAKIDLLKSYASAGKEPPAGLIDSLDGRGRDLDSDESGDGGQPGSGSAFLVVLFAGLAGVFAFTGYTGLIDTGGDEFYFIALILAVLSFAFLVSGLFGGRRR